jgi:hypothetical protein
MSNKHEKSPCCGGVVVRDGGRRRKCTACHSTWRVWKRKRGRKALRHTPKKAITYITNRTYPFSRLTSWADQYRRTASRDALVSKFPWPRVQESGPLVLIADAFLQYIEHSWYTWYCILARAAGGEDAVILEPYCRRGTEVALGWQEAFSRVPNDILVRTKVLVSDGHIGLIVEARRRGWLIQRCHFHLIARFQQRRSRFIRGFHRDEGKRLYKLVVVALKTHDSKILGDSLEKLAEISHATTSRDVRRMISGFLANYDDYRTYLCHPELRLPTTSNTAEAFVGLIRDLCHRAHGFRTVRSMNRWIEALVKVKGSIKCRGEIRRII